MALALLSMTQPLGSPNASAYCTTGMSRWLTASTMYYLAVAPSYPSHLALGSSNAASQWNAIAGSNLRTSYLNTPNYTSYPLQGYYFWPSGLSGVIAPGFASKGGTAGSYNQTWGAMYLNPSYTWINGSQDIANKKADVQTVVVHELGHMHGLAHPYPYAPHCTDGTAYTEAEKSSVMTAINTGTRRLINSDDRAGIAALY